jgi:hypothetical protein
MSVSSQEAMPVGVRNRHSGRAERGRSIAELQHKIEYDILVNTNDIAWYTIAVTEREAVSICDQVSLITLHIKSSHTFYKHQTFSRSHRVFFT